MKNVVIQFILSFNEAQQQFSEIDYTKELIQSPQRLFGAATQDLTPEEVKDLYKISCCVYGDVDIPDWYKECNGKLWVTNGELEKI